MAVSTAYPHDPPAELAPGVWWVHGRMRMGPGSLPAKAVTRLMGFMHRANIGPPWKKFMTADGGSLRPDFDRLLELPFDSLIGAHGQPLLGGAKALLRDTVDRVFD